tara:strand:- start:31630 stop:31941 length:312 start_codon:yes stop_codon:yes gene_type:complete
MLNDLANRALKAGINMMGEAITYTRADQSWQIKGMFQTAHIALDPETGGPVSSQQPILGVNARDLPITPKTNDRVTVRGHVYRVRDAQPDGHTLFTLMLQKVS